MFVRGGIRTGDAAAAQAAILKAKAELRAPSHEVVEARSKAARLIPGSTGGSRSTGSFASSLYLVRQVLDLDRRESQ